MLGWHFARDNWTLGYGDGREIVVGETLTVGCEPVLCESGLHASKCIIDALAYAPGAVICRVRLGGEIKHGDDKSAATERTVLAAIDGGDVLRDFARRCALDVAHLWDCQAVVMRYLRTGDEHLRSAACAAACAAAYAAADDASMAASSAAYHVAADYSARVASRASSRAAYYAAADDAADAAARAAARSSARASAWTAACAAARARQNRRLAAMVTHAMNKTNAP